ncbi:unnamed protein product [Arabidopsis thaliana]|jgi:hypothetical protein|uniref:(thale cress) hypothetical protein n=1 Tax=Arabidopsis thaliana TaxID=3702 RepID=A0A7G2FES0_ARATH|nr:unnamed protein product [Arabidopsis thaliana]
MNIATIVELIVSVVFAGASSNDGRGDWPFPPLKEEQSVLAP